MEEGGPSSILTVDPILKEVQTVGVGKPSETPWIRQYTVYCLFVTKENYIICSIVFV